MPYVSLIKTQNRVLRMAPEELSESSQARGLGVKPLQHLGRRVPEARLNVLAALLALALKLRVEPRQLRLIALFGFLKVLAVVRLKGLRARLPDLLPVCLASSLGLGPYPAHEFISVQQRDRPQIRSGARIAGLPLANQLAKLPAPLRQEARIRHHFKQPADNARGGLKVFGLRLRGWPP